MLRLCYKLDDTDFSWASAKASHVVFVDWSRVRFGGWSDTDRTDKARTAHAQRHRPQTTSNSTGKVLPCVFFNVNSCMQKNTHETKGFLQAC